MNETKQTMANNGAISLSITQIIYIIVGLLVLYFTIIKPSIARGVCYNEAKRIEIFEPAPNRVGLGNKAFQDDIDKRYRECKVYNAGKVWHQFIFEDLKL